MADAPKWTEHSLELAGGKLHVTRAGKGPTVLVLHHDIGTPDKLAFYDQLAQTHDVIVPHHPGWGKSTRLEWMRSVRDIAVIYRGMLAQLGVKQSTLVGLGFGGWIAAEMATMGPSDVSRLVLVGPMGIKPDEGYILDQAIVSYLDYAQAGFHDPKAFTTVYGDVSTDQLEAWDIGREMSFRIAWKPYMYNPGLPHLLSSVKAPALIVWGDQDRIVPMSTAAQFKKALPNAKVEIVKGSGHCVEMERPAELAKLIAALKSA